MSDFPDISVHEPDPWRRAAEVLVNEGKLAAAHLREATSASRNSVAAGTRVSTLDYLVERGMCSRESMVRALAQSARVPFVDLQPEMIESGACQHIGDRFLVEHNLVVLAQGESSVTIATEQFTDLRLADQIKHKYGLSVTMVAADAERIRAIHELWKDARSERSNPTVQPEFGDLISQYDANEVHVLEQTAADDSADLAAASDSPVINLVNRILDGAVNSGASDVHIEPGKENFIVRYRIDGILRVITEPPEKLLAPVVNRIKVIASMDISERRLPQDGVFSATVRETDVDFRISTMRTKYGEKVVMRLVVHGQALRSLEDLGMDEHTQSAMRRIASSSNGLVLVTGPTGSGKTTTLYALLDEIVSVERNVSTIEDPVERRILGSSQFQINERAGFGFPMALRSLLRQDPDVIMVGEVRDQETAALAVQASLTGHTVFTTLHTNDAISAIPRLVDMGVEPYLICASLRGVLAQRLLARICSACRRQVIRPECTNDPFTIGSTRDAVRVWEGAGCSRCSESGVIGRIGIFELLELHEQRTRAILDNDTNAARALERTMLDDGIEKADCGLISIEDLRKVLPAPKRPMQNDPAHPMEAA